MCGISVLIAPTPRPLARELVAMTDLIGHRGPDDEGFACFANGEPARTFGGRSTPDAVLESPYEYAPRTRGAFEGPTRVGLGHRRLSIVDLSPAGHQPMSFADGRYWIAYNGEVYNHAELRAELEGLGHRFRSSTDTEVVLAAYAEWGEACLERFNGMWAFAIWDAERRVLFAARDRFGIKPLYLWRAPDGTFALASEIKQFTALEGWRAEVNAPRLYEFLAWSIFDHSGDTFFAGVRQVPGGHALRVRVGDGAPDAELIRWYDLPDEHVRAGMNEAKDEVRELLHDAVRGRLRADVKVGSCLSGGIDSSAIVCLVNRELDAQGKSELQETVSSCSELPQFDERPFIDQVLAQTRTKAHYVFPDTDQLVRDLDRIVWHQDEPFASTSIFAQWCVFERAREAGLTVMLDGQGADELFAGYRTAFAPWIAELLVSGRWGAMWRDVRMARELHRYKTRKLLVSPMKQLLPASVRQRTFGRERMRYRWLKADLLEGWPEEDRPRRPLPPGRSLASWSRDQLLVSNLPMLLHYEDRNSMAHSVESRVPYLDYRLVEYVLALPGELKIHRAETKAVLREAMRGILPDAIRERRDKMAFVTAESVWFREQPERFRPLLERACDAAPEVFDRGQVLALADDVAAGRRRAHTALWRILCVGAWMERFHARTVQTVPGRN